MTTAIRQPATHRFVAATLIVFLLAVPLALLPGAGTANAGTNSGVNGCLKGYSYADPANNYLFASSDALASDCYWLSVEIRNNGDLGSAGFNYTWCWGTVLSYREGYWYVSTSSVLSSGSWNNPCSNHIGAPWQYAIHKWGALNFVW